MWHQQNMILPMQEKYGILSVWETMEPKAADPPLPEGLTLRNPEEEGGDGDDYISGFFLVLYIHCCPDKSDLPDFEGQKEIAATTAIVTAVCKKLF